MVGGENPGYMWWGKSRVYVVGEIQGICGAWEKSRICKGGGSPGSVKVGKIQGICGGVTPGNVKVGEIQGL